MTELDNIEVFKDTLKQIKNKYVVDDVATHLFDGSLSFEPKPITQPITFIHGGTVNTGYSYADKYKVAILNFADALKPCGWVENGAQTQEENICRCTNLYKVLTNKECKEFYYDVNRADVDARYFNTHTIYSIRDAEVYTDRVIYTGGITVFKDDTDYHAVEPRKLDVITCPAPRALLPDSDALNVYINRMKQILFSAIECGAECVVLGAWGCGAFCQNPVLVAKAFGTVLSMYGGYFKEVVFAVKPTPQWGEEDLYGVFKSKISRYCEVAENE